MTDRDFPVSEDELHAYVDGELPSDRQEAVARWLAAHPQDAARIAEWRAQTETIRARYGATASEPVPERLKLEKLMRPRPWRALAAAAALVAFIAGGASGWVARGVSAATPNGFETFTADALDAHRLYVVEVRHPVEVPASERAHMVAWLSKRVGYDQRVPDLEKLGLKLVGGRLLPGPTGAAAFYMYEGPSGERYTIYCARPMSRETALRFRSEDKDASFYWSDKDAAFVVSGPADRARLQQVTQAVYEQVDPKSGS